ncbi:glycoside hydrolase family 88 protein [Sphingobacterium spiritivorum]|uniref:glycoside hydrolase family 88 protein n=1 Tax=Sphingobacterium spiritivorum TaxID=258 RepID=UPI003DA4439C
MKFLITLGCLLMASAAYSQTIQHHKLSLTKDFVDSNLNSAVKQIKYLAESINTDEIPTTFNNGKHINFGTGWWCSGFYPGTLLYLYEFSKDPFLIKEAKKKLHYLEKEKNNKTTHDLGFMLFCSFGNAFRLMPDSTRYKEVLAEGAQSLASRYNKVTKTIRSWDTGKNWKGEIWQYPVIIDNMMNLEFLLEVSKITQDKNLRDVAISHADVTLKNHFRKDGSSYHVVDYDGETGKVLRKNTAQGAFDESAWSRGQSWALYGYTMMYRETKKKKYLQQARKIARFYLTHHNLPTDLIPYWDMDQDKLSSDSPYYNDRNNRDASTAAIMASALLELSTYSKGKESQNYIEKAEKMLTSLSHTTYKSSFKDVGGFILMHSVGSIPHKTEVDVPLTYADYYYVEALMRYKRMLENRKVILEIKN